MNRRRTWRNRTGRLFNGAMRQRCAKCAGIQRGRQGVKTPYFHMSVKVGLFESSSASNSPLGPCRLRLRSVLHTVLAPNSAVTGNMAFSSPMMSAWAFVDSVGFLIFFYEDGIRGRILRYIRGSSGRIRGVITVDSMRVDQFGDVSLEFENTLCGPVQKSPPD